MNKIIKTELIEWENLKLFQPKDLKSISSKQLKKLKESLKKNGFKLPFCVWQENKKKLWCLDGHTRIPALRLLKEEGFDIPKKLPANFIDCKNKKDAKKAILIYNSSYADINKESLFDFVSDLNFDQLNLETNIKDIEFDFKNTEIKEIENKEKKIIKSYVKDGDVVKINEHTIICGDAFKDVQKIINSKIDMVFTDPPYDLNDNSWIDNVFKICDKNIFIMQSDKNQVRLCNKHIKYFKKFIVLVFKNGVLLNNKSALSQHTLISHFCKTKQGFNNRKDAFGTVILDYNKNKQLQNKEHKHSKDIFFIEEIIKHYGQENDTLLDLFSGSGSFLLAADKNKRVYLGIEKEKINCDLIIYNFYNYCLDNKLKFNLYINGKKINYNPE